jgi:hypothetical protein
MKKLAPAALAAGLIASPALADVTLNNVSDSTFYNGRAVLTTTLTGSGKSTYTLAVEGITNLRACLSLAYSAALTNADSSVVCLGDRNEIKSIFSCTTDYPTGTVCKQAYKP